jgi:hypothetical protein
MHKCNNNAGARVCAYRVSDAHTDYRRLPQSFHCCSLSFRTSTTPPRPPRPSSRPSRNRRAHRAPSHTATTDDPVRPISRHRQSSGVNRIVRTDVVVRVPRTHTHTHSHTHTHMRARAPHTVVRENPTPAAAAIVNQ